MKKWKLLKKRTLFGQERTIKDKSGRVKKINTFRDPNTGEEINTWGIQVVEKEYLIPKKSTDEVGRPRLPLADEVSLT